MVKWHLWINLFLWYNLSQLTFAFKILYWLYNRVGEKKFSIISFILLDSWWYLMIWCQDICNHHDGTKPWELFQYQDALYMNSHHKDKMVSWWSYLYNGYPATGNTFLIWNWDPVGVPVLFIQCLYHLNHKMNLSSLPSYICLRVHWKYLIWHFVTHIQIYYVSWDLHWKHHSDNASIDKYNFTRY